jgi:hypothetical protein
VSALSTEKPTSSRRAKKTDKKRPKLHVFQVAEEDQPYHNGTLGEFDDKRCRYDWDDLLDCEPHVLTPADYLPTSQVSLVTYIYRVAREVYGLGVHVSCRGLDVEVCAYVDW